METICSADFPLTPSGCVLTPCLSSGPVCLFSVSTCHMGGGRILSRLTPLLGPGLPEDRNPGPTTLHDSLRPGGAPCSPARRLEAVAPPPGLRGHPGLTSGTVRAVGEQLSLQETPPPSCCRDRLWEARASGAVAPGSAGAIVVVCALSCSTACGIFLDRTCGSCVGRQILYH